VGNKTCNLDIFHVIWFYSFVSGVGAGGSTGQMYEFWKSGSNHLHQLRDSYSSMDALKTAQFLLCISINISTLKQIYTCHTLYSNLVITQEMHPWSVTCYNEPQHELSRPFTSLGNEAITGLLTRV
jgi:hypothetical protein